MCISCVRFHRLASCAFAVLAVCSAARAQDALRTDFAPLPTTTIDPDRGHEAAPVHSDRVGVSGREEGNVAFNGSPSCTVGGCDLNCATIGGWSVPITGSLRYRGDLVRVTQENVVLCAVKMQLSFTGTADLYVSVHRREADGTYTRVANDIVLQGAVGTGSPLYYSTPCINVAIPPGDYAIAFAWGSTSIKFAHDGLSYPRTTEVGSVLGSVAFNLNNFDPPQPPVDDTLQPLQVFVNGAYPMELCLVPAPGACCSGNDCLDVFESECEGEGGYFHGQRTTCAETPCEFGACCDKCGRCQSGYTPEACDAAGGLAHWPGTICPADPATLCEKVTGACCNGTSCNDALCEADCVAAGWVYRGDGTDCTPNICQGGCCVESLGECFNFSQTTCAELDGEYKGDGTTCATLPPALECGGACCTGTPSSGLTTCSAVSQRSSCGYIGPEVIRAYKGDLTDCAGGCGQFSEYHKCCLPDGVCLDTTSSACSDALGKYEPSLHCTGSCPKNACCFTDGTCRLLTVDGCTKSGGLAQAGNTCPVNLCQSSIPTGACCGAAAGACTVTTRIQCESQGKVYAGDYSNCSNPLTICPGFGACCRINGDCFDGFSAAECATVDGTYQSDGSVCSIPPVDCDNRGACCTTTDHCLFEDPTACAEIGGLFKGEGVACEAETCIPHGGCCINGACWFETEAACGTREGTYLGDDTQCPENACTPGACCQPGGSCGDGVLAGACAGPGQSFTAGALCIEVQCVTATGACCNQNTGVCTNDVLQQDCQGAGVRFGGSGSTCATLSPPCAAPTGACCVESTGVCTDDVPQANCQAAGQRWGGAETTCVTLNPPCVPPAPNPITSSTPAHCTIDARVPFVMVQPGPQPEPRGFQSIALTFERTAGPAEDSADDYSVQTFGTGPDLSAVINGVVPAGNVVTINFTAPIPTRKWTCVLHKASNTRRCLGYLPADTNGNRTSAPLDILEIIDNLNGVRVPPLAAHQCDIDRNATCAPADILSEIDLLNGASGYQNFNGATIDVTCPSATGP